MMNRRKKYSHQVRPVWLTLLGLVSLGSLIRVMLRGTDATLFKPKGQIAQQQFNLIMFSVAVMLAIAIPTLILFYFFAWRYRESNEKATYDPNFRQGKFLMPSLWAIPSIIVLVLASVMWSSTHKLDPQKPITADSMPLTIQVVALRWKWLFIYPEQNIATINFVQVPIGTPLQFELTADEAPMSSFWIPHLGGQLYAMTGHTNRLNLIADTKGDYAGSSAEINGAGFADMKFIARASSNKDFDKWVQKVQMSSNVLNSAEYKSLLAASKNNPADYYSETQADLYDIVLMKYMGSHQIGSHKNVRQYDHAEYE